MLDREKRSGRVFGVLRRCGRTRSERGTAMVEMALVLPWLLLLILGMIDFGKAINYWIDQTHLANEGVRWATVNNNPGGSTTLQDYIRSQAETVEQRGGQTGVKGTQQTAHSLGVSICFYKQSDGTSTSTPVVGDTVEVIVSYQYDWMPFLTSAQWGGLGPNTTITGKSAMRLEVAPTKYFTSDNTGPTCPSAA
jgi:Flp pilus assembly protein TadG